MTVQRAGVCARIRVPSPPRVYLRSVEKLTRMREKTCDPTSRTLSYTFPRATGSGRRSAVAFVALKHVPDFEGESAWFEMEKVQRATDGHGRGGERFGKLSLRSIY